MLIASLTQRPDGPIGDPRAFVRREFAGWGVDLDDRGTLETPSALGTWEWLTVEEARTRFAGAAWLDVEPACPFVGPTLGYVLVGYLTGDHESWDDVLIPLLKEGRGVLASTVTGEHHVAVTRRRTDLSWALTKYGMDDGAEWLERRWNTYHRAVAEELERALAAAGWHGWLPAGFTVTAHNPWRWSTGGTGFDSERELWERFGHVEVDLWLYDFEADSLVVIPPEHGGAAGG